jgi:hypothetical protein
MKSDTNTNTDIDVCVPQNISKYGVYSSQLFLINSICNYVNGYNILCVMGFSMYIFSMLHWHKMKSSGLIRNIDIFICVTIVNRITFYDSVYFCTRDRYIWIFFKILAIIAYFINKHLEYYQQNPNRPLYFRTLYLSNEPYNYFSLNYTWPNTPQRLSAHKYAVYIHIFFLHICLASACINGVVNSPSCSNYYFM